MMVNGDPQYKLSIITINLNNKEGLEKTARSIAIQTNKAFEWIVIDGGSDDGSTDVISNYEDLISYHIIEPDNGIFNAMNKGILNSHGEYLFFLNSGDALYEPDVLAKVLPLLKGDSIYIGKYVINNVLQEKDLSSNAHICHTLLQTGLLHQTIFYNRMLFNRYGLYNESLKLCADWEFNVKTIIFGGEKVVVLPFITTDFAPGGVSSFRENLLIEEERVKDGNRNLWTILDFYSEYGLLVEHVKKNFILRKLCVLYAKLCKWI